MHVVTQAQLLELQKLRQAEKAAGELSSRIKHRLQEGAKIEQGSLTARLKPTSAKRLSKEAVAAEFGAVALDQLMDRIEPTVSVSLIVESWA
jgi:hypothetical protein